MSFDDISDNTLVGVLDLSYCFFVVEVLFIFSESLNEAVGHEPLRLLVSVDEDDFRKGRLKLLKNLTH